MTLPSFAQQTNEGSSAEPSLANEPTDSEPSAESNAPDDSDEPARETPADQNAETDRWTDLILDDSFSGWVQFGGNASFTMQRDEIVGTTRPGIGDSFLCTEAEYDDFELELECKIEAGLNSGIQIRSQVDTDAAGRQVYGYQIEIDSSLRGWTGSLYDQSRAGWLATTESQPAAREAFVLAQWNQVRVLAVGSQIRSWVNGVPAIDYAAATDRTGIIGLQIHHTETAEPLEVRWRRLRIRKRASEDAEAVRPSASASPDKATSSWSGAIPVGRA